MERELQKPLHEYAGVRPRLFFFAVRSRVLPLPGAHALQQKFSHSTCA
jgi:hypothetical protein